MTELTNKVDALTSEVQKNSQELRKLAEVVARQIRIEEKYLAMDKDLNGFGGRITKIEDEVRKLGIKTALATSKGDIIGRWVERLIYFIVIAALAMFNPFKAG